MLIQALAPGLRLETNMNKFFSLSTLGFYAAEFHADYIAAGTWPVDAVEVDAATETKLRAAIGRRDTITRDGDGWKFSPHVPDASELFAALQSQAIVALTKSDITVIRCAESNTPVPAAWAAYRQALRAIVGGVHADALPAQPAYPA